ncbi:hypothetical protein HN419_06575 [Candidatus Woesearchaeota archaeon]|jgi:chromosome segregation ATPase|nr:hypothetical protein [Candidatus Woesearchaeota archaeon]MBT7928507.1 hypothetical protein [Candidatus Peregrinibacteria bacterium]MBT3538160.1 hypothetical protein [Candidatus Woesearchaeota archaeon]MBT4697481.1 hypothetical protein [Candidatus Woesearchaeota archaeon]MBT4716875.1 hypothetical protein [Candidatus Woesearchaeota archaeon]
MDFINKNANFFLILLILISVCCLIIVTVYYQQSFSRLNTQYVKKVQKLEDLSADLQKKELQLNRTVSELSLKERREDDFTVKYSDIKDDKEELQEEKNSLESTKASLEKQLRNTRDELTRSMKSLQDSQRELATLNTKYNSLDTLKKQVEKDLAAARKSRDTYEDKCEDLESQVEQLGGSPVASC